MVELVQSTLDYRQDRGREVEMCLGEFSAAEQVHLATSPYCEVPLDGVSVNQVMHCILHEPSETMVVAENPRVAALVKALR